MDRGPTWTDDKRRRVTAGNTSSQAMKEAATGSYRANNGAAALEARDFSEDCSHPDGTKSSSAAKTSITSAAPLSSVGMAVDKDRKIGHRRVNEEGEVSYKKIHSNQLVDSIQLGIRYSVGVMTNADERDLLMQDFMTLETHPFPRSGGLTPAHSYTDFKFATYAPLAFRYFLNLFGIARDDFMMSLGNEQLRELSNPGASGSLFFLTKDDEFIIKTVQHKESQFLQKLLPGYYMNLNQNPHTLLPKFFGMFCYQCNQKNIRLTVMNNLLPSEIKMHLKFDLKGSTYKRKANKRERAKASPTYKDLDFMDLLPDGLLLEQETYNALITTMRRDCRVLESFMIMDYSLLVGIHNLDLAAREEECSGEPSPARAQAQRCARERAQQQKQKLVAHSTAMESIQAQTEPIDEEEHLPPGGIPARNHKGERLLLYLGIIDILQSFRMRKKLEHTLKAVIHDGDTVSVHRPGFYAHRFLDFMADKVFRKIPSPLKHSPSKKGKVWQRKLSAAKPLTTAATTSTTEQSAATTSSAAAATSSGAATSLSFTSGGADATQATSNTPSSSSSAGASNKGDLCIRPTGRRPDVVPGLDEAVGCYSSTDASSSGTASIKYQRHKFGYSGSPGLGGRKLQMPKNRQRATIQQHGVDDLVPDTSYRASASHQTTRGLDRYANSRLSAGTSGSSGCNYPTPNTWTEGTPSYTQSSLSGASLGPLPSVGSATARGTSETSLSDAMGALGLENIPRTPTKKIETCSYQETEM